jgi:glycosyltransferase involved in cell wall biosynthesis
MNAKLLRIGVDARLIALRRGMGNYIYHLLSEFARLDVQHSFVLYVDSTEAIDVIPPSARFCIRMISRTSYPVWEQVQMPRQLASDSVDLIHSPANTAPVYVPKGVMPVLTVHDIMYLLPATTIPNSSSVYQRLGRAYRSWIVPHVARRAEAIITVSQHSRRDIIQRLRLAPERVKVIYEAPGKVYAQPAAINHDENVRMRYKVDHPYVFSLGALDPRKNTMRVIEAFARFITLTSQPYILVISGLNHTGMHAFGRAAATAGVSQYVRLLGFVSEPDLAALYRGASMLAYPSLYEGFGLPVLEAMACGVPVISSNVSSIPEVAGDAALLIDPYDIAALTQAMSQLATDFSLRDMLIARGQRRAAQFSWTRAALETIDIYEKVAGV